jgi:hypothetical protein
VVVVDYVHGTIRKRVTRLPLPAPQATTGQVVSLLDLPARTLAISTSEAAQVTGVVVRLDNDRRIAVPAQGFRARTVPAGAAPDFTYRIAPADIENVSGEFAALFRPRPAPRAPPVSLAGRAR